MHAFLQAQLDFIYFFYGLTFVFLGMVSFLLKRQISSKMPWQWLGAFGILHGFNKWYDMIDLSLTTSSYWLEVLRLFFLILSLVCLFEFGRQSWNQFHETKIGLWVYIVILVSLLFGWQFDKQIGLEVFSVCLVGISGAVGAGFALWKFSNTSNEHKNKVCFGAIAFWLYALSLLILPYGNLFGLNATNQDVFFNTFGFPIQFIRGIFITVISVCVWLHFQNAMNKEIKEQKKLKKDSFNLKLVYALLGILISGWLLTESLGRFSWYERRVEDKNIANVLSGDLEQILVEGKDLSKVLSGSPEIVQSLENGNAQTMAAVNEVLDTHQTAVNVSIAYVLDKNGNTIASSNRNTPDSLVGKNYAFRPYFINAIKNSPSILFAIGVTTKKAGFYFSYPIKNEQGVIIGVAVVKMDLSAVEENFQRYGLAFLVSPEGVVFLSSQPQYNLRSVNDLSFDQKKALFTSKQYGGGTFEAIFDSKPVDDSIVVFGGRNYLVTSEAVNGEGWSVLYLQPSSIIGFYRLFGIMLTFILYILTVGFFTMAQDIRRSTVLGYLASIIYSSSDAIIGKDFNGIINSWNEGAEKIYGYTKEEVFGKSERLIMTEEEFINCGKLLKQIAIGKSIEHYETTHLKKNGEVIFVSLTISPVRDSLGAIVGASMVSRDITKERIAVETLKHSEKKFSALFNSLGDMVFISDLKGNFLDFNEPMIQVLGYTKNELYKMKRQDINSQETEPFVVDGLDQVIKDGTSRFEAVFKTKTGVLIPVDLHCHLINYEGKKAILNSVRDITDKKATELDLKKQMTELEKFKLAVDGTTDSVMITDKDAVVLYANEAVVAMTGFDRDEIMNQYIGHLWGGHMEKGFYEEMWNSIKNKKKVFVGELNNRRKTGEEYIVNAKFYPLLDKNGEVEFFVGVETDITKAKQTERTKAEFVSVASHQLRTPLTGIKWFSELLLKGRAGKLAVEQKDFVQQIFDSNDRMIKLVDDLLDVSHMDENGRFKLILLPEEFSEIVKEVVSEEQLIANNKKIKIKVSEACLKKMKLKVDKSKIEQAIQNILNNAIKYSPAGSTINFDCKKEKDNLVCSIQDHGIGIPEYQHFRVFEKFFRADNVISTGSGTGLGLYISKYIVSGHAGKMWFDSKENEGTTFYISLPIK